MGEDEGRETILERQAERKGAIKEEVLAGGGGGCFCITDCVARKFKPIGIHRCIPGVPNMSLFQNVIP